MKYVIGVAIIFSLFFPLSSLAECRKVEEKFIHFKNFKKTSVNFKEYELVNNGNDPLEIEFDQGVKIREIEPSFSLITNTKNEDCSGVVILDDGSGNQKDFKLDLRMNSGSRTDKKDYSAHDVILSKATFEAIKSNPSYRVKKLNFKCKNNKNITGIDIRACDQWSRLNSIICNADQNPVNYSSTGNISKFVVAYRNDGTVKKIEYQEKGAKPTERCINLTPLFYSVAKFGNDSRNWPEGGISSLKLPENLRSCSEKTLLSGAIEFTQDRKATKITLGNDPEKVVVFESPLSLDEPNYLRYLDYALAESCCKDKACYDRFSQSKSISPANTTPKSTTGEVR